MEKTNSCSEPPTMILAHVLSLKRFCQQRKNYAFYDEVGHGKEPRNGSVTNTPERMSTGTIVIMGKETVMYNQHY